MVNFGKSGLALCALVVQETISDHSCMANSLQRNQKHSNEMMNLPARFARLTRMSLIVVSTAATTTTAKSLPAASAAARRIGLRFRFIDFQRPAGQFGSIQRRNGFVRFRRIGHFHKGEAAG